MTKLKKKALIIGFGSIGQKHAKILQASKKISDVYILTKQKCKKFKKIKNISEIKNINPDYIVIASKTSEHFKHLSYLEKNFKKKLILIEKPLFNKSIKIKNINNKIFVGYNLRFHPVIQFIKEYLANKKPFLANASCTSYLPNWRKNINYENSNSAKKSSGGGALLELSHELDYLNWFFKITKLKYAYLKKISNLKINTEDFVTILGESKEIKLIINLNYLSLNLERTIVIDGNGFSLKGDLINYSIKILEKNKKRVINFQKIKDLTYKKQHDFILNKKHKNLCSYLEGIKLMKIIENIKNFKNT